MSRSIDKKLELCQNYIVFNRNFLLKKERTFSNSNKNSQNLHTNQLFSIRTPLTQVILINTLTIVNTIYDRYYMYYILLVIVLFILLVLFKSQIRSLIVQNNSIENQSVSYRFIFKILKFQYRTCTAGLSSSIKGSDRKI